jgi:hypothetical protein
MGGEKVSLADDLFDELDKNEESDYGKPIATVTDEAESIRLYNRRFTFGEITEEEFDAGLEARIIRRGMTVDEVKRYFPPDEHSELNYNRTALVRAVLREARRLAGKDRVVSDVITNRNFYYSHLMYTCRALGDTDAVAIMSTLNDVLMDLVKSAGLDDKVGKVKLFKSIFRGRDDVYGFGEGLRVKQPLTSGVILRHLEGKHRLSIYPLLPDNTTFLAVADIDDLDLQAMQAYLDVARTYEVPTYLEVSKSGGYHLWTFFTEPVPAPAAGELVKRILRDTDLPEAIKIFPRQPDLSSPENLAEYINVPLFGEDVRNGRTVFLNEGSEPHADQWEFLASVKKMTPERLEEITKLNHIEPSAAGEEAVSEETTAVAKEWHSFYTQRLEEKAEHRKEIEDRKEKLRADTRKLEEVLTILNEKVDEGLEERYQNLVVEPIKRKQDELDEKMGEIEEESKRLDADVICLITALEKLKGYTEAESVKRLA